MAGIEHLEASRQYLVYGSGQVPVLHNASYLWHVLVPLHQRLVVGMFVLLTSQKGSSLRACLCLWWTRTTRILIILLIKIIMIIIWLLHNLVKVSFDLFRYLLLGDQLKPWELHPLVSLTGIINCEG